MRASCTGARIGSSCLASLVLWCAAVSVFADPPPAALSRQDMLREVQTARARIQDLTVTFSMNAVEAPENYVHAHFRAVAAIKDDMIYTYSSWGRFPDRDPRVFEVELSSSGTRSVVHEVQNRFAWVKEGPDREVKRQGLGFFDLMLLHPAVGGDGYADNSLESLLACDRAVVRPEQELVNNRWCHVVDLPRERGEGLAMTCWMDGGRGMLPLRTVRYSGNARTAIEYIITDAVQIEDLWFAARGRREVFNLGSGDPHDIRLVLQMEVEGWDTEHPSIELNRDLTRNHFDLASHLPPGTWLRDLDTKENFIVSGDNFTDLARAVNAALLNAKSDAIEASAARAAPEWATVSEASDFLRRATAPDHGLLANSGTLSFATALALLQVDFTDGDLRNFQSSHERISLSDISRAARERGLNVMGLDISLESLRGINHIAVLQMQTDDDRLEPYFIVYAGPKGTHGALIFDPVGIHLMHGKQVSLRALERSYTGTALLLSTDEIRLGGVELVQRSTP